MNKVELVDGGLWVSPPAANPHHAMLVEFFPDVRRAARDVGLRALLRPNLRLGLDRCLTPDIAVGRFERDVTIDIASDAVLVVEVTAPGHAVVDRTAKKVLYAEAKIGWYLLVEPDFADYESVTLQLFRLEGAEFVLHAQADHGETLAADEPFPFEVDTFALVDF